MFTVTTWIFEKKCHQLIIYILILKSRKRKYFSHLIPIEIKLLNGIETIESAVHQESGRRIYSLDDVHANVPEVVPLEFEHPHVLEPVKGEAGNLDETVFVQLKDPQAF